MSGRGRIEVVGHGGAGHYFPSNTRPSIERALDIGVDRVEFDVQLTSDGVLVLGHDENVVVDGVKQALRGLGVDTLRLGIEHFLTLDELIELVGDRAGFVLDMKAPGYEREVAEAILRHGVADRTIVSSTYALGLRKVRRLAPGVEVGLSSGHLASALPTELLREFLGAVLGIVAPRPLIEAARRTGAASLMVQHRVCSPRMVAAAHRAGLRVYAWTVDDEARMDRLIELGVDGITSNRPDIACGRLAAAGRI